MSAGGGHALVLGDGDAPTRSGLDGAWPGWDDGATLVVAADGGARLAVALGLRLDRWIGDADSFPRTSIDELAAAGVVTTLVPTAKDESDLELAVAAAAAAGVASITVLGSLGGRLDHELANVALLAHPSLRSVEVRLLDDRTRVRLISASDGSAPVVEQLSGRVGDIVSLLPLDSTVDGVTTTGLLYPLADEPLRVGPARGLSNVRTAAEATVSVRAGRLLVIETPATVDR